MRKAWILACALLFVSVAGFADGPAPAPLSDEALAAILGEPLAGASCATAQAGDMGRVSVVQNEKTCSATVTCRDGSTRTCMTATGPCNAVQPDCVFTLEPGHVTCTGATPTTVNCPACCTGGGMIGNACCRCDITGDCFDCCRCSGGTLSQCAQIC